MKKQEESDSAGAKAAKVEEASFKAAKKGVDEAIRKGNDQLESRERQRTRKASIVSKGLETEQNQWPRRMKKATRRN